MLHKDKSFQKELLLLCGEFSRSINYAFNSYIQPVFDCGTELLITDSESDVIKMNINASDLSLRLKYLLSLLLHNCARKYNSLADRQISAILILSERPSK